MIRFSVTRRNGNDVTLLQSNLTLHQTSQFLFNQALEGKNPTLEYWVDKYNVPEGSIEPTIFYGRLKVCVYRYRNKTRFIVDNNGFITNDSLMVLEFRLRNI